jgi:hypothetical protein
MEATNRCCSRRQETEMSLGFTSQLNDPDLDRVSAALLRAGQRARELARQTGTGMAVEIDGELPILQGPGLDGPAEPSDAG